MPDYTVSEAKITLLWESEMKNNFKKCKEVVLSVTI